MKIKSNQKNVLERMSTFVSRLSGTSGAFLGALSIIIIWLATGPIFNYSDTWQLVINTGTTIITFLMVFLIQRSQNKDALAIQLKLNELIASSERASNRLIDVEDMSESELEELERFFVELVKISKKDKSYSQSHSVDEAIALSERKAKQLTKKE